jgi:hypothetical protein
MLFAALIIVAVSGLIAYVGDWIGRKMGRRRLTLLGLRPRYTAIVISVGVGVIIASLTLAATFVISKPVRDAFITPVSKLKADKLQVELTLETTQHQVEQMQAKLIADTRVLNDTSARLEESGHQRTKIQAQLTTAKTDLIAAQKLLTTVHGRLVAAQREFTVVRGQLDGAKDRLVQVSKLKLRLDNELMRLEANRDALQAKVTELNERVDVLSQFALTTFAQLAFTSGQELLTGVFATTGTQDERRRQLVAFFAAAERVVRAQSPDFPKDTAALLCLGTSGEHPVRMTTDEAINRLATRLGAVNAREAIIRLAPVNNVPVNAPAMISMEAVEVLPNTVVFQPGDEVARITLPARADTAELLGRLVDELLRTRVPAALRAKQMVMVTRRFDAAHPDALPVTHWSLIPWNDLLPVAERAHARGGAVQVVARTRGRVTRSGPVDLTFDVLAP